jgi:crotonobetainyl-CoA:carnitine CoA-transferase CaiB-like acyl-CoA transferase
VISSDAHPVDLDELRAANPALVTVAITPFGETGPKAGWPATDLTVLAAGCQLAMTGDDDRPPVRTVVPQAFLHACSDAAAGAMVALAERANSGLGQHVSVSAQRSVLQATQSYVLAVPLGGTQAQRKSGGVKTGGLDIQLLWPCKDGYASVTFLFGSSMGPFSRRLMNWIHEEGYCDEATRDKDWIGYTELLASGREPIEEFERVKALVATFTGARTKAELLAAAVERDLLIHGGEPGDIDAQELDAPVARRMGLPEELRGAAVMKVEPDSPLAGYFRPLDVVSTRHGIALVVWAVEMPPGGTLLVGVKRTRMELGF